MTTILTDSSGQSLLSGTTPLTVDINGDLWTLPPGPSVAQSFLIAEVDVFQAGSGVTQPYAYGIMAAPIMAATVLPQVNANTATLYASDIGYVSKSTDTIGTRPYPPVMDQSIEIDRMIGLAPDSDSTAGNGVLRLSNLGRRYDSFVQGRNSDSRPVRIFLGNKTYDGTRGLYVDPSYSTLTPFFTGTAGSWTISEDELEIPLFDSMYWADRPLQSNLYSGTGGLNGGSDLTNKPKPIVRGGTSAHPVQNVPLTAVDTVNLIYQYTDAAGTIVTLYEGGAAVFTYDGDVANLYSGTPPAAGHYRTCNASGLVQMGSTPVRALTADVTGSFLGVGTQTSAAYIAYYLMTETMGLPLTMIDTTSFSTAGALFPYTAGFYAGSGESGLTIVKFLLRSINAKLYTTRGGKLSTLPLRKVTSASASSAIVISVSNGNSVVPQKLSAPLDPPAFRWRVGYNKIYQVQTSDYNGSITAARKALINNPNQVVSATSGTISSQWLRPSDPDVIDTALLIQSEAQLLANDLITLWAEKPDVWVVQMPITSAVALDIGTTVKLQWPLVDLSNALPGQIVGEQVRTFDQMVQFSILVGKG